LNQLNAKPLLQRQHS